MKTLKFRYYLPMIVAWLLIFVIAYCTMMSDVLEKPTVYHKIAVPPIWYPCQLSEKGNPIVHSGEMIQISDQKEWYCAKQ